MNDSAVKKLLVLALCGVAAVLFGAIVASQSYENLLLLCYLLVGIYVLAAPGFAPLLAFGLLNPFFLPIPFIWSVPFILLILGICCVKLFFLKAVRKQDDAYRHCFTWATVAFFAWVMLRYCVNPVLPNTSGFGANVTGFRSYLNYGICFALLLLLPFFVSNRSDVIKLLRWTGGISLFFILLFIPLVFSKSLMVAVWLQRFGLFVTLFDNGMLRFVVLPGFGLNVLMLSFFPNLWPARTSLRIAMGILGMIAIVLGGNRGTLVMAFITVLAILLVRQRVFMLGLAIIGSAFLLGAFHFVGEYVDVRSGVGFLRVLSLGSQRLAYESGAAETVEWRMIRWKRALQEIEAHPVLGKGYGGLENAWIFSDMAQFEEARVEVDLAAGGIHNGYLNCAYSLGIPAVLFFLAALVAQSLFNFRQGQRLLETDTLMSELHCFAFANLAALAPSIYAGTDLNAPIIWLYLTLGVLATRLKREALAAPESSSPKFEGALVSARLTV